MRKDDVLWSLIFELWPLSDTDVTLAHNPSTKNQAPGTAALSLHRRQELGVRLGLLEPLEHNFHLLSRREGIQDAAHDPDTAEIVFRNQQLFLARSGALQVDSREQTLVAQAAIEMDFAVAGAFELFENHVVHARAGIDQRSRNDRQRAAFFDVARRAEETLRSLQARLNQYRRKESCRSAAPRRCAPAPDG